MLSGKHFNFECSVSHLIQNLFLELVVVPPKTLPSIPLSAETVNFYHLIDIFQIIHWIIEATVFHPTMYYHSLCILMCFLL